MNRELVREPQVAEAPQAYIMSTSKRIHESGCESDGEASDILIEERNEDTESVSTRKIRSINVEAADYGYIVRVGCQTVAVEDTKTLTNALTAYLADPRQFEKDWNKEQSLVKYK